MHPASQIGMCYLYCLFLYHDCLKLLYPPGIFAWDFAWFNLTWSLWLHTDLTKPIGSKTSWRLLCQGSQHWSGILAFVKKSFRRNARQVWSGFCKRTKETRIESALTSDKTFVKSRLNLRNISDSLTFYEDDFVHQIGWILKHIVDIWSHWPQEFHDGEPKHGLLDTIDSFCFTPKSRWT